MRKFGCQLLRSGDPVSTSHGDISFQESCCEPSCERQEMYKVFHYQFKLHTVVRIFQIDRRCQSLFLPLQSVVDIVCESSCFFTDFFFFLLCTLLGLGESRFILSRSLASFLVTIRAISFPVVFCIVRIRYPFRLLWPLLDIGAGMTSPRKLVLLQSFLVCCDESASSSTDRFLMSDYLTLSGPAAMSLLSLESVSVYSSSVTKSSFEPASVKVLSRASQTAFLSSRVF